MTKFYYAGIGSRSTPLEIQRLMAQYASRLERLGFTLRTGGAVGADTAFECGVQNRSNIEIFRPRDSTPEALNKASLIHPAWDKCNETAKHYHGRNVQIILGKNLDTPVEFVIYWTPHISPSGGTRTGVMLAKENNIPTFNLRSEYQKKYLGQYLFSLEYVSLLSP